MRRTSLIACALAVLAPVAASAAAAPAMTVDDFLAQWQAIKAAEKVPSQRSEAVKETVELSQVLATSFGHYKALLDSDKKAGKAPRACPVKGSTLDFKLDELVAMFNLLPPDQRRGPVEQAYFAFLDSKLPCTSV